MSSIQACYAKGLEWSDMAAVEFSNAGHCYPLGSAQAPPTNCPSGCSPGGGQTSITQYAGDGNAAHSCVVPSIIQQQGLCRENTLHGGYCTCGIMSSREACYAKGLEWSDMAAVEIADAGHCYPLGSAQSPPTNCPSGCSPSGGQTSITQYAGDGNAAHQCWL